MNQRQQGEHIQETPGDELRLLSLLLNYINAGAERILWQTKRQYT